MARGDNLLFQPLPLKTRRQGLPSFNKEEIFRERFFAPVSACSWSGGQDIFSLSQDGHLQQGKTVQELSTRLRGAFANRHGLVFQGDNYLIHVLSSFSADQQLVPGLPMPRALSFFLSKDALYAFDNRGNLFFSERQRDGFAPWQTDHSLSIQQVYASRSSMLLDLEKDGKRQTGLVTAGGSISFTQELNIGPEGLLTCPSPGEVVYLNQEGEITSFLLSSQESTSLFSPATKGEIKQIEADSQGVYLLDDSSVLHLLTRQGRLLDRFHLPFMPREMELRGSEIFLADEQQFMILPLSGGDR